MSFGACQSNWDTSNSPSSLLPQYNFQMSWFGNVKEVLRVSAPELVLLSTVQYSSSTSCVSSPLALVFFSDCLWQLNHFNWVRAEHSQKEWSFVSRLVGRRLNVWNNNVVYILLLMGWGQPQGASNFSLFEPLNSRGSFIDNIVLVNFPKSISL